MSLQDNGVNGAPPSLVALDPRRSASFAHDLQHLDSMSCRAHHTVHVFYVRAGQSMPFEILNNVVNHTVLPHGQVRYCLLLEFRLRRPMCTPTQCSTSSCCLWAGQSTWKRIRVGRGTRRRAGRSRVGGRLSAVKTTLMPVAMVGFASSILIQNFSSH